MSRLGRAVTAATRISHRYRWKDRTFTAWVESRPPLSDDVIEWFFKGFEMGFEQSSHLHALQTGHASPSKGENAFHVALKRIDEP